MLLVSDLRLEAEILPLFNFAYCHAAETAVLGLLRELPANAELVLEKQAVFRALLMQW